MASHAWRAAATPCHRCGGDLQVLDEGDGPLFCPHCGAPQLILPEHLRVPAQPAAGYTTGATTGTTPPPRPMLVDWQAALRLMAGVAGAGALLSAAAVRSHAADFASTLWALGGGAISLVLYSRQRPAARVDGHVGARIGLVTGLLTVAFTLVLLAVAADVSHFALHRPEPLQHWTDEFPPTLQAPAMSNSGDPEQDAANAALFQHVNGILASDEGRAGRTLFRLGLGWAFLLAFSTGSGALAGALQTRKPRGVRA